MKKWFRKRQYLLFVGMMILAVGTIFYSTYLQNRRLNPASCTQLLHVIGKAESKGNYNAYFGSPGNTSVKFTDMTIADVQKWQANYIKEGNPSSAVGKYQIINTTLAGLVHRLGIDPQQKFDAATQDRLAVALIERRGGNEYVNDDLTQEQLAHNLAKEWAGLPKVVGPNPDQSYYAGDSLNKSRVSVDEVMQAIEPLGPKM